MTGQGFTATVGGGGSHFSVQQLFPDHRWYDVPESAAHGLADAAEYAEELTDLAGRMLLALDVDMFDDVFADTDPARWLEVAALIRSSGEATTLVVAALLESAGMLAADERHPARRTVPSVATFVTEAATQYLMGVGHDLANVALRVCLESPACRDALGESSKWTDAVAAASTPGTDARAAWISHSATKSLAKILRDVDDPAAEFTRVVAALYMAPDWRPANAVRDEYFHRVRAMLAAGDDRAFAAAVGFHEAAVRAAQCLGRAIPSLYYTFIATSPRPSPQLVGDIPLFGDVERFDYLQRPVAGPPRDRFTK